MARSPGKAKMLKARNRNRKKRWSKETVKVRSRGPGVGAITNFARNSVIPSDPWLDAVFPGHIYLPEELLKRAKQKDIERCSDIPRATVIARYLEMVADSPRDLRVLITPDELRNKREVWMHFTVKKDLCFLIELNHKLGYMRKSYEYHSPFKVKEVFQKRHTQWHDPVPLRTDGV